MFVDKSMGAGGGGWLIQTRDDDFNGQICPTKEGSVCLGKGEGLLLLEVCK